MVAAGSDGSGISWYFQPSQPRRFISGLRETFINISVFERTSKAEMRRETEVIERNEIERAIQTETDARTE